MEEDWDSVVRDLRTIHSLVITAAAVSAVSYVPCTYVADGPRIVLLYRVWLSVLIFLFRLTADAQAASQFSLPLERFARSLPLDSALSSGYKSPAWNWKSAKSAEDAAKPVAIIVPTQVRSYTGIRAA